MSAGRITSGLAEVTHEPTVVSIGFFDGVHRGHRSIITRACQIAERRGVRSAVVTFDRHPMEVVRPGSQPKLLMTLQRRAETLAELGVDLVVVLPFDDELRHLPPQEFVDHVLVDPLQAVGVVVGANFRFGHKAAGNLGTLAELGAARGFSSEGVTLMELDGEVISSTAVRTAVDAGDVERAARMLGRAHLVDGVVVRGDHRGAALGYPTANLQLSRRVAVPSPGVYAGIFHHPDGRQLAAATSVGTNPTFGGQELRVEAFLLDTHEDLYGLHAALDFRHRLRDQQRFERPEELITAIDGDVAEARRLLGA